MRHICERIISPRAFLKHCGNQVSYFSRTKKSKLNCPWKLKGRTSVFYIKNSSCFSVFISLRRNWKESWPNICSFKWICRYWERLWLKILLFANRITQVTLISSDQTTNFLRNTQLLSVTQILWALKDNRTLFLKKLTWDTNRKFFQ